MPVMVVVEGKEERRSHGASVNLFQWFTLALWQSISRQNQRGDHDAHGKIEGMCTSTTTRYKVTHATRRLSNTKNHGILLLPLPQPPPT